MIAGCTLVPSQWASIFTSNKMEQPAIGWCGQPAFRWEGLENQPRTSLWLGAAAAFGWCWRWPLQPKAGIVIKIGNKSIIY